MHVQCVVRSAIYLVPRAVREERAVVVVGASVAAARAVVKKEEAARAARRVVVVREARRAIYKKCLGVDSRHPMLRRQPTGQRCHSS